MEVYQGKIKFNDVATNPGKNTKRFFGQIEMLDAEGDTNSYQMVSFRSQVISQSENLGKNGMSGKSVKVKGEFTQNTYNGNTSWQLKIDELFIEGMESLAEDLKQSTEIQMPKKPSDVTIPTNPVAPLVEAIPQVTNHNHIMPGSAGGPQAVGGGGYVYNPSLTGTPSAPQRPATQPSGPGPGGPQAVGGGYVYNPSNSNVNTLPSSMNPGTITSSVGSAPSASNGYVYNSTNNQAEVKKPVKELHKLDNFDLPSAY